MPVNLSSILVPRSINIHGEECQFYFFRDIVRIVNDLGSSVTLATIDDYIKADEDRIFCEECDGVRLYGIDAKATERIVNQLVGESKQ